MSKAGIFFSIIKQMQNINIIFSPLNISASQKKITRITKHRSVTLQIPSPCFSDKHIKLKIQKIFSAFTHLNVT